MAKVVLFNLRANLVLVAASLFGCANPARDLPPDMSSLAPANRLFPGDTASLEFLMSCPDLAVELAATRAALSRLEAQLQATQAENQSKAVVGLLVFTPLMLSMNDNKLLNSQSQEIDVKRERLLRISQARQCPA